MTEAVTTPTAAVTPTGFDRVAVTATLADGTICELCLWRAATAAQRGQGLTGVTDLGAADGMLFAFDGETAARFWMKDTPLALDIAWFATDGSFVSSTTMTPCLDQPSDQCARYGADAPYQVALELAAGRLEELGIGPGTVLRVGDGTACAGR